MASVSKSNLSHSTLALSSAVEQKPALGIGLALLGLIWIVLVGAFIFLQLQLGTPIVETLANVLAFLAMILPLMILWIAARILTRLSSVQFELIEIQRAQHSLKRHIEERPFTSTPTSAEPAKNLQLTQKLEEIAEAQRKTETALSFFVSSRKPADEEVKEEEVPDDDAEAIFEKIEPTEKVFLDQELASPELDFGTPEKLLGATLSRKDFVRAIDFPKTATDNDGFEALRRALKDREAGQMVQAAQDILTLLSEIGIYMDDITPDRPKPELWRKFADGDRGRPVAALGAIHDKDLLQSVTLQMRNDPIFRDAAHHFLRVFDKCLVRFEKEASDEELRGFGDTRTARAFMILGRTAGTFD